ncbi:MAG TPA: phosphoglycolate phosphatase [Hyphomicrobiales bacterium]|nr:phosphoglycolate phosphatase [Hyphomicrobiales bacterium]
MADLATWPRAVVFDLDGTLIDSAPDLAHALNRTLQKHGLPPFPLEEVKGMIGGGLAKLAARALDARGFPRARLEPFVAEFVEFYREDLTRSTRLYEGAAELLELLVRERKRLGLCTNKAQELTLQILNQLGLAKYFSVVIGEVAGIPHKPDPVPLLAALAALDATPEQAIMVGDSAADVECAKRAGVSVVAVSFGYSRTAPHLLGADAVIESFGELPAVFSRLAAAPAAIAGTEEQRLP